MEYPELDDPGPELGEIIERIGKGRPYLPNPYRMLLWSPDLAEAWLGLANAVRFESGLDDRSRELTILLVAHVSGSEYERHHHSPIALAAGLSPEQIDSITNYPDLDGWEENDRAVLAVAGAVAEGRPMVKSDLENLRRRFGEPGIVELAASVSYYLGLAHFLLAFEIELETDASGQD